MSYENYRYIFIGAAILCAVMIVVSVLLFFLLRIPKVISDLTGRTARKAIEEIRNQNETSGDKVHKTSLVNKERGKVTDKISPSGRILRNPTDMLTGAMATQKIATQKFSTEETSVLESGNETTVLDGASSETTLLTGELSNTADETTLLSQNVQSSPVFEIEYEITYIHTNEVIPVEVH